MNTLKKKKLEQDMQKKLLEQEANAAHTNTSHQPHSQPSSTVASTNAPNKFQPIAPSASSASSSSSSSTLPLANLASNSHYGLHPQQMHQQPSTSSQQLQSQQQMMGQQYLPHQSMSVQPPPLLQQFNPHAMSYPTNSNPSMQGYNQPLVQHQQQHQQQPPQANKSQLQSMSHLGSQPHQPSQSYQHPGGQLQHSSSHLTTSPPFVVPQFNNNLPR